MVRQGVIKSIKRSRSSRVQLPSEDELMQSVQTLCNSKAEEFRMYGYEDVTGEQIWACVSEEYRHGRPRLNRLINDIMSLKANVFMNWLMISVYRTN